MVEERQCDGVDPEPVAGFWDEAVEPDGETDDGDQDEEEEEERDHVVVVAQVCPDDREEREEYQERHRRGGGDGEPGVLSGTPLIPGEREIEQDLHDGDERDDEDRERERPRIPEQGVYDVGGKAGEHDDHEAQPDGVEERLDRAEVMEPERLQHEDPGEEGEVEERQSFPGYWYVIPDEIERDHREEGELERLEHPEERSVVPVIHPERVWQVHGITCLDRLRAWRVSLSGDGFGAPNLRSTY